MFNIVRVTEVMIMSAGFALRTLIEFAAIALLLYGLVREDDVIAFEQSVKRIVVGNVRRIIRIRKHKKAVARGEHLRLHSSGGSVSRSGVA